MMATLSCKHCGAAIPAESISDGELAICEFCAALNNLSDEPIPLPQKPKAKRTSWIPDKLTFRQHPDGVEIKYRWLAKQHWFLLFFSSFWNGIVFLFVFMMLAAGEYGALIFTSLHVIAGVLIAYYTLLGFVNSTTVTICERDIQIISRPIPVLGRKDKQVDRRIIEQVYVKRRHAGEINDESYYVFDVHYIVKGESDAVLLHDMRSHEEALFIEQQIERLYQIENEPVTSEWMGGKANADAMPLEDLKEKRKQK